MAKMILMRKRNSGQTVLIALLIGLVVLTIGLGVASRAVTDIKLSRQEEESMRAFNIAEAGIEELLKKTSLSVDDSGSTTIGTITREVNVYEEGDLEVLLDPNETIEIDLSGIDFDGSLTVSWVKDGEGEDPGCIEGGGTASASIEVMVYREESGTFSVRRSGYNSCATLGNEFKTAGSGSDFKSSQEVDILDNNDKLVRIRVLYNKATVKVAGSDSLGALMYKITSRAQAQVGETRQVEVQRTKPALPPIFDYVLFSGSSLVK